MATALSLEAWLLGSACATAQTKHETEQSELAVQIAVDHREHGRIEAALSELQRALALDPRNADAYNVRGLVALQQGLIALNQAEELACLKGQDGETVRADAAAHFRDAEKDFRRALEIKPELAEAANNLSVALLNLQDWDGAAEAARTALKDTTYPSPDLARANLGWALYQKKDLAGAWKELLQASRSPRFCVGHYRLARVHFARGDYDDAAEEAAKVVAQKDCGIQDAYLLGGMLAERRKEPDKARQLFVRCLDMGPKSCLASECRRYAEMP